MTGPVPASPRLGVGLSDFVQSTDLVLCDVWGVIHNGVRRHDDAVEALRAFRRGGGTVILITNAPVPQAQVRARLDRLGVSRDAYDDIATSGDETVAMVIAAGLPALHSIGPAGETVLYDEIERITGQRPRLVSPDAAALAICLGLDDHRHRPDLYDADLRRLGARDVELICANPDIVVEVGETLIHCAGAIAERYAAMGGRVAHAGKPFAAIYERAFAMARAVRGETAKQRVLAIGDAMATDVAGAANQGIASLFVTTGIHRAAIHEAAINDTAINGDASSNAASLSRFLSAYPVRPTAAMPRLAWDGA